MQPKDLFESWAIQASDLPSVVVWHWTATRTCTI